MLALAPLTGIRVISSWRLEVPALVVVLLLAAGYLAGVRRVRRAGEHWPVWRAVVFLLLGLGSLVVVTMSSLGVYDRVLFWPRAVQYTVMVSVAPLLLALGEPLQLARRCLGGTARGRLDGVLRSRAVRVLSFPLVGALLGVVVLMIVYFTPLYRLSLTSEVAHQLVLLGLLITGAVFFVPELDQGSDLLPPWCGAGLRVAFAIVDGLVDALPGVVIMTSHGTIARGYYAALHRGWGPSVKWDQTIGGALMFTVGELVALPFLVTLVVQWFREDERTARETDLLLDEQSAALRNGSDAGPYEDGAASTRPWWETDPGRLR